MTEKFNASKKKSNKQPYDSKIDEKCENCSSEIVYRKNSYFGKKTYFKICNNCGWYELLDSESWGKAIAGNKIVDEGDSE
ncbi:hypothetical protein KJ762_15695 [bacterium]|nr:hypothetical protein [bacterium]MBU1063538.1 hypothetical protein [bacterium]MBU1635928.1 hypothetical protein [bacterium]MBU1875460.1 hypothetical protein [bacterium]